MDALQRISIQAFHEGQAAAFQGNNVEAVALMGVAAMVSAPNDWWYYYVLGTSAYLRADEETLRSLAGHAGPNESVIRRLLQGLGEFGAPNYLRDYGTISGGN